MKKLKKILLSILMIGSVSVQSHDESLFVIGGTAGITIAGIMVWRATAPSDEVVLQDIAQILHDKNLIKYEQRFQLNSRLKTLEHDLVTNLYMLGYQSHYQDFCSMQKDLQQDAYEFEVLKNSIWFRSFFNEQVLKKYQELYVCLLQIKNLEYYFNQHVHFFKGWNLCKEYQNLKIKLAHDHDRIHGVRKFYILNSNYPLLVFVDKLMSDIVWIKNLKKGMYPELENELVNVYNYAADLIVYVKSHAEYDREKQQKYQDDEEKRKQDIVKAQLLIAQAAVKQADIAALNAKTERERLELEKEQNERARIQARIEELRRYGYSDEQIQAQLDFEGFTKALINIFFRSK